MVRVKAVFDGKYHSIKMRGHANYAPSQDIVCAACSALIGALLGWIDNNPLHIERICRLTGREDMIAGIGNAEVAAMGGESLHAAFMTAVIGLARVSVTYPQCVEVYINGQRVRRAEPHTAGKKQGGKDENQSK